MTKESRLSFRIDEKLSHKVDIMVDKDINIRDRSDFGTQSIQFFMDVLENKESDVIKIIDAINSIAREKGYEDIPEIKAMNKMAENYKNVFKKPRK